MFNYLKPNNLLKIINKTQKFIFIIFLVIISIGLVEALILSPEDYKQSDSVRIMCVLVLEIPSFSFTSFVIPSRKFPVLSFPVSCRYQ